MTQILLNANAHTFRWPLAPTGKTHVLTDPPYSPRVHTGMASCAAHGERKGVRQRDAGFGCLTDQDREFVARLAESVTGWTLVYSDLEGVGQWRDALTAHVRTVCLDSEDGDPYVGALPWFRWSMPQLSGDRPPQGSEAVVLARAPGGPKLTYFGPGNLTAIRHTCLRGEGKHPTEKPLDQALDLVAWFTSPGDLVLDPYAGRGTFGLACLLLGRSYLGTEQDGAEAAAGLARIVARRHGSWTYDRDRVRAEAWLAGYGLESFGPLQFRKGVPA